MNRMPMTEANYPASIEVPPRKTVTRRVINPRAEHVIEAYYGDLSFPDRGVFAFGCNCDACRDNHTHEFFLNAPYKPGEIVALTLPHWRNGAFLWDAVSRLMRCEDYQDNVMYGKFTDHVGPEGWRRMAARYMPLWACLHFAEILSVRAERLKEITDEDCLAEGIEGFGWDLLEASWRYLGQPDDVPGYVAPVAAYAAEWDALHGVGAWEKNKMVWVYGFKQAEKPDE